MKKENIEWTKKKQSTTKIQTISRGFLIRKAYKLLKSNKNLSLYELNYICKFLLNKTSLFDSQTLNQELSSLRKKWVVEIRELRELQLQLQQLDSKISLLIKHRISIREFDEESNAKKLANQIEKNLPKEVLQHYSHLFYLLQLEPKYLARTLYLVQKEQLNQFLQTMILTLFGYAFSPREEYLLLRLFTMAIREQVKRQKEPQDFAKEDPVITQLFVFYFRRVQYQSFLCDLLSPIIVPLLENKELDLELNTTILYRYMINEEETRTGKPSSLPLLVTHEKTLEFENVRQRYSNNLQEIKQICSNIIQRITDSLDLLPYGIRYISREIYNEIRKKFPRSKEDELKKIIGYIVYYRYIIPAIISPEEYNIIPKDLKISFNGQKNLALISKILQNICTKKLLENNPNFLMPLNDFIQEKSKILDNFTLLVTQVQEPEEFLEIDVNFDLSQREAPNIFISQKELVSTHLLFKKFLHKIAPSKEDNLRVIMAEIDYVKIPKEIDETPVVLFLANKFHFDTIRDAETQTIYNEAKELLKRLLYSITLSSYLLDFSLFDLVHNYVIQDNGQEDDIDDEFDKNGKGMNSNEISNQNDAILEDWEIENEFSKAQMGDSIIPNYSRKYLEEEMKILERDHFFSVSKKIVDRFIVPLKVKILILEQKRVITRENNYQKLLSDVIFELRNSYRIQRQNLIERDRLLKNIETIQQSKNYINSQMTEYNSFLDSARNNLYQNQQENSEKSFTINPLEFTFQKFKKDGIIISTELKNRETKRLKFVVQSTQKGIFDIQIKFKDSVVDSLSISLEDLLEKQFKGERELHLESIILNINLLINLINSILRSKK
ncbi:patterned expression site [Anaeramoeba ignava]|uniref:Patterned expression site n=1 Tax=Anaeramoeba ignava TaxID=1746090 RepID=A0A9Q0L815_ANAIG|nr:patterned expression site [Anaeramoeba ignava]